MEGEDAYFFSTNHKASSLFKFYLTDHPRTYAQGIKVLAEETEKYLN